MSNKASEHKKIIGTGRTAVIYEWDESKVLKLFHPPYPKEAAVREYNNAKAISGMNFEKPKPYELIDEKGQMGIVYDKVEGILLLDWVISTRDISRCAVYMANLHQRIMRNIIYEIPDYKEFLILCINKASFTNKGKKEELLQMVHKLPDGYTLLHGDFHPGNIILTDEKATVIDFMNICHGHFLYDVARTVYLVQYTPVAAEIDNREEILQFKRLLADDYLKQMGVSRADIWDFLTVISAARAGECPEEKSAIADLHDIW